MAKLHGLGLDQTYVDAQRIVTALERAKTDPDYFGSAAEILNAYVEPERTIVVNKAIALGADRALLLALLTNAEVIEVVGTAPVIRGHKVPWWAIVLGGFVSGAVIAGKWRGLAAFV